MINNLPGVPHTLRNLQNVAHYDLSFKKSTVQKATLDPVWNENFELYVLQTVQRGRGITFVAAQLLHPPAHTVSMEDAHGCAG